MMKTQIILFRRQSMTRRNTFLSTRKLTILRNTKRTWCWIPTIRFSKQLTRLELVIH